MKLIEMIPQTIMNKLNL